MRLKRIDCLGTSYLEVSETEDSATIIVHCLRVDKGQVFLNLRGITELITELERIKNRIKSE